MGYQGMFILFFVACLLHSSHAWSVADETSLRGSLIAGYETSVRPSQTVTVDLVFQITGLVSVDIKSQTFSVSGFWVMVWEDTRLSWTPASYGGIDCLYYYEDDIWTPAFVVTNSNNDLSAIDEDTIPLRVKDPGTVEWTPPCLVTVGCEMDTTYFPFDRQTCSIEVTSSGYRLDELNVNSSRGFLFDYYTEDGDWEVMGSECTRTVFADHGNNYAKMMFTVELKRRNDYHWINVIIPLILTGCMANFVFVLPVDSGEKMGFALTCMLTYVMLLTMVAADMPTSAKHTALLEVYITVVLFIGGFSVIQSVLSVNLYQRDEDDKVPRWMRKAARIGMKICLQKPPGSSNKIHVSDHPPANTVMKDYMTKSPQGLKTPVRRMSVASSNSSFDGEGISWKMVSNVFDAVCFRLSTSFHLLFTVIMMLVMAHGAE